MSDTIIQNKLKALEEFKQRVLNSKFGNQIVKMVLFGSVNRKEATKDSDIDILIFSADNEKELDKFLSEVSYDIWWETGERIEKLIFPLSEIRYPRSWLVYRTLKEGREIYSMKKEEIKKKEQEGYARLSNYFIQAAKKNLTEKLYRAAVDLAYNGAELAVKGLLLFKLDELPTSHGGVVNKEKRNRARYVFDMEIHKEDAETTIHLAEELLNLLESKL